MNVLLISQCDKRALKESRRILDQFAERRGDRTWQTAITQAGLSTLRKLLRKTARKNTAVACHWIRGRGHSELMWVVGNAGRFNAQGAVPTNSTQRNILRHGSENDWHTGEDIQLLARLAALLHDLGKIVIAFQERLRGERNERNLYRHEWVSLRLFLAFVGGDDDHAWLQRLADPAQQAELDWIADGRYLRDGLDSCPRYPFRDLPPTAQAIAWLIVTHHRLPQAPAHENGEQKRIGTRSPQFFWQWIEKPLDEIAHDWNEVAQTASKAAIKPYWHPASPLPTINPEWQKQAAKIARRLLDLSHKRADDWLDNPYVMHLARLSLMLGDHYYSSLGFDANGRPAAERDRFLQPDDPAGANTVKTSAGQYTINQTLTEHLLGVAHGAGAVAHALPGFERYLPRLLNHRGLRKRTADPRFRWQDKVFDAATAIRAASRQNGGFVVNMASTGCGKTLANARILYALADPQIGLRATYALGLRSLTLQTGRSYRTDLHLDDDELAVLVGGSASRELFEHHREKAEATGSSSIQSLLEEDSHVLYEGNAADHPLLARALANLNIRKLLSAPMLVCTVDHIAPATEATRAGRQIAPMLRLMSSDLILDELDDYDLNDIPALTRLVHWAGLLGARVVLSSATLPPALVEGMFMAYRAGRSQYQKNRGADGFQDDPQIEIPCIWTDEFAVHSASCTADADFSEHHEQFVRVRAAKLEAAEPLRLGELIPLDIKAQKPEQIHREFAHCIHSACLRLHGHHAEKDPITGKQVSFGIVRVANIEPLIDVATELCALGAPEDTQIHLCVYHARFPLALRSAIEQMLDQAFNRRADDGWAVYQLPDIRAKLDTSTASNHLFVVLASPVCEVGRDWDADWAIAEPSSMRALIQLAGRVQRHRRRAGKHPNILIFDTNLKHFKQHGERRPIFLRPGFEDRERPQFQLSEHRLHALLEPDEYKILTALPRIRPRAKADWQPQRRFVDLEQTRIAAAMGAIDSEAPRGRRSPRPPLQRDQAAAAWQYPQASLTGLLPQQQPFREQTTKTVTLAFLPDEDEEELLLKRVENDRSKRGQELHIDAETERHNISLHPQPGITPWGEHDLLRILTEHADALDLPLEDCAKRVATVEVLHSTQGWRWHPWLGFGTQR
jgi:CRISPR-associated endonuclease/helicase Cas3